MRFKLGGFLCALAACCGNTIVYVCMSVFVCVAL